MLLDEKIITNKQEFVEYHAALNKKGVECLVFLARLKDLNTLDPYNLSDKLESNIPLQFTHSQSITYFDFLTSKLCDMGIVRRLIQIYLLAKSTVFQDPIVINRIDQDNYVIHPGTTRLAFHSVWPNKLSSVLYYDSTGLPFDLHSKIKLLGKRTYENYPWDNFPFTITTYNRIVEHKQGRELTAYELHRNGWKEEIDRFAENKKLLITYDHDLKEIYFNKELVYCKNSEGLWALNTNKELVV